MLEKTMKFLEEKKFYIIRGVFVLFLFLYSAYFQYIPVKLFHIDLQNISDKMMVLLSLFSSTIVFLLFFILYRKELKKDFKKFIKEFMNCMDTGLKCWLAGLGIMMVTNIIINVVFQGGGANNEKLVQSMIHSLPVLMIINAGFLAPFNEEIVFRKVFYDIFQKYKWVFVILSFLLFGGAHVVNNATTLTDYLYIVPYGALGASFALAYYKTDTVFTSITFHMIHNLILIILSIMVL